MELLRIHEPGRQPEMLLKSGDFVRVGPGINTALNFEGSNTIYPLQLGDRTPLGWKVGNAGTVETLLLRHRVPAYVVLLSRHDSGQDFLFRSPLQLAADFFDSRLDPIAHFQKYPYPRQHRLAAFTHAYNEGLMLRVWIDFYSRYVPKRHLYVIDHGGDAGLVEPYRREVNVISIPRGEVDHYNMATYCGYFQRFLLTQYDFVLHVDTDEMVVFEGEPAAFAEHLAAQPPRSILKPAQAYDLVHDFRVEPPIDLGRPFTLQRNCLLPAPAYHKPVVASAPTTWFTGYHDCVEATLTDPLLWMVHLRDVDLGHSIEREARWKALKSSALDRTVTVGTRHDADGMRGEMLERLEAGPITPVPDWMKGVV